MEKIVGFDIGESSVKLVYFAGADLKKAVTAELPDNMVSGSRILSMDAMADFLRQTAKSNGMQELLKGYDRLLMEYRTYSMEWATDGSEDNGKLTPKMEIINKERLLLKVTCDTPRDPLHFYVTVTDAQGHSTGRMELTGSEVNVSYRTYTVTMVLDDLTEGKRFSQQRRFRQLTPGSDLTLKVEVESDSRLVDSVTGKLTTNSLFAEVRNGGTTAVVTYARHLQNLDEGSGLPTAITRALQEQDIQFVNTGMDDGWDSCYPGRRFTPIYNENLTYYDSTVAVGTQSYHPVIYELPVDTDGDGGLFESFRGTLRNIRLCGAEISAGGNAGGLAGSLRGGTTIEGCQVYLSPTRDKLNSKNEQDIPPPTPWEVWWASPMTTTAAWATAASPTAPSPATLWPTTAVTSSIWVRPPSAGWWVSPASTSTSVPPWWICRSTAPTSIPTAT